MQTFITSTDFLEIARNLDYKRLNKQIQEVDILIDLLLGKKDNNGKNHPAYKMWVDFPAELIYYRNCMLEEWIYRDYNTIRDYRYDIEIDVDFISLPSHIADQRVIISHRSNLVMKYPEFYSKYGWIDYGIQGYFWPCGVKSDKARNINKKWTKLIKGN